MKKLTYSILFVLFGLSAFADTTNITYIKDVLPIIMTRCFTCHHPNSLLPDWTDYSTMFRKKVEIKRRIWDSWDEDSLRHYYKQPMPVGYGAEALAVTKAERDIIRRWIMVGAPKGIAIVIDIGSTNTGWMAPLESLTVTNSLSITADEATKGKSLYIFACQPCHGLTGKGDGVSAASLQRNDKPVKPADFTSAAIQAQSDGSLFWKIKEGRSPMPSWKTALTDEQCWQIVEYIRTLK